MLPPLPRQSSQQSDELRGGEGFGDVGGEAGLGGAAAVVFAGEGRQRADGDTAPFASPLVAAGGTAVAFGVRFAVAAAAGLLFQFAQGPEQFVAALLGHGD